MCYIIVIGQQLLYYWAENELDAVSLGMHGNMLTVVIHVRTIGDTRTIVKLMSFTSDWAAIAYSIPVLLMGESMNSGRTWNSKNS